MHSAKDVLNVDEAVTTVLYTCVPLQSDFEGGRRRGVLLYSGYFVIDLGLRKECIEPICYFPIVVYFMLTIFKNVGEIFGFSCF